MMAETKNTKVFYNSEIPNDWVVKKVGEVAKIETGAKDTQNKVDNGLYPFFVRSQTVEKINTYSFEGEAVLTAGDGVGVGKVFHYINGKFDYHQRVYKISDFNGVDGGFFFEYFKYNFIRQISKYNAKASVDSVRREMISTMEIPLPPLSEQKAISQLLSTADAAIHNTEKLIAQKELRKKWLMQQLLSGKKRLKGFGGEWKEKKLGKLFSQIKNVNDGGDSHSIMTISSKLGLISQEDKFDRVIAGDSLKKYTQLVKGDFAYNKGNSKTYPMGCIYRLEEKESALVPFVYICFSPKDLVDGMFYKHWFLAHGLDRQLNKIITSGARGDGLLNVNTVDFFVLKIIFPPKEEQTAIAQVLQAADKEINLLKTKAEKLRELKKGMMQVLLTGKVRLKID